MKINTYPDMGHLIPDVQTGFIQVRPFQSNVLRNYKSIIENSDDVDTPDYYVMPITIHAHHAAGDIDVQMIVLNKILSYFPLFKSHPDKHIFFQIGDRPLTVSPLQNSIVFQESGGNKKTLPMYLPAPNSPTTPPKNIKDCELVVSFQGATRTCSRIRSPLKNILQKVNNSWFFDTERFIFNFEIDIITNLQKEYTELMNNSKFVACPRGSGTTSYRFYETLAWGRLPILIGDEARLPLKNIIDYDRMCIRVPESQIETIPNRIEKFCCDHDLEDSSIYAAETYKKYFFDANNFIRLSLKHNKIKLF